MERRGLGKGLSALFNQVSAGENIVRELSTHQIRPNPYQPRKNFAEEALEDLIASIKQVGVLQPIIVRQIGLEEYELIAGERRLRACIQAGLEKIPAIIRDPSHQQMLEIALIENVQRQDINPVEAAHAYKRLIEEFDLTQEQVAERVGKKQSTIANTLRLLTLPDYILKSLEDGLITEGHARALLMIKSAPEQRALWQKIISDGISVRAVEQAARDLRPKEKTLNPGAQVHPLPVPANPEVIALQQNLSAYLGTKTSVVYGEGGQGRIVIEFYGEEDLGRILDILFPDGF